MNGWRAVWSEFFGLFVEDGWFAAAILIWLAACWLVFGLFRLDLLWPALPTALPPVVLFVGLVVVLVQSAARRAGGDR